MRDADEILYSRFLIAASGASHDSRSSGAFIGDYFASEPDMVSGVFKRRPEDDEDKAALDRIVAKISRAASDGRVRAVVEKAMKAWSSFGQKLSERFGPSVSARTVSIFDNDYPPALREISAAPLVLFMAGAGYRPDSKNFAVVGTRAPSKYCETMCETLSDGLIEAGFTIVSGMAAGIDSRAHERAVLKCRPTYAVLGSGVDRVYPSENRALYERILRYGAVISEFLPGAAPQKGFFVLRNRIITGMSRATLVCGAGEVSGALISARYAFDQSREVFSICGDCYRADLKGCHELIKKNMAKLVLDKADILRELYADFPRKKKAANAGRAASKACGGETMEFDYGAPRGLNEDEKAVLAMVEELSVKGGAPVHIEAVGYEARRRGMAPGRLLAVLSALELKGFVEALEGKRYQVNAYTAGEKK